MRMTMNRFISLFSIGLATTALTASAKVDFAKDVFPILERQCFECHNAEKQKGELRLDTRELMLKGGDTGAAFVPGKGAESLLVQRVMLPRDDDDAMPPKGDGLTKAQQDLLKQWIDEGADWPAGVVVAEKKTDDLGPGPKPSSAELKAVAELAKLGIQVREVANNVNWRYANLRVAGTEFDSKAFTLLGQVQNLLDLNLSNVKLKDADLKAIGGLKLLQRLNLSGSTVTDAGLAHLGGLGALTYLNLFNTQVTDAGLKSLAGLKNLKNIYLFETKATEAGVAALKKSLPQAKIDTGWDMKELAKIEAEIKQREADKKAADEAAKKKEAEEKKAAAAAAPAPAPDAAKKEAPAKKATKKKKAEKKQD